MMEFRRHDRRMSLHRSHQLMPEHGWWGLGKLRRHEPLGARQYELVADRLVEEHLRLGRVELWTDEPHVDEMHAHGAGLVLHRAFLAAATGKIDAAHTRVIAITHRRDRILVLVKRGANRGECGRAGRGARALLLYLSADRRRWHYGEENDRQ